MKRVLFVCTGNLCRSPMAEGLFRALVRGREDVEVQSAGLSAMGGHPPSLPAIDVLLDEGIDIGAQRSQPLTADLVAWATHIFVMTHFHLEALAEAFPRAVERIFLLREFQEGIDPLEQDVEDPIGSGPGTYAQVRDTIRDALLTILQFIDRTPPDAAGRAAVPGDPMTARGLAQTDPEIAAAIAREHRRQYENIELIASENFTSRAVMEAQGSVLTNKYAEGYPGRRWYGGCEHIDKVEQLAIERARQLFGAAHVNVQPHSGSQANMAVYFAALQPGDRILTMDLAHGGHLTHGHRANFSGRFFQVTHYGVSRQDERLDYDALAELAARERPRMITAGASAYPRVIDFERLARIAESVGAYLFVDMAHIAGLVAAGVHPNPVPHAHFVSTTTHKSLRGPRGGLIFCREEFAKQIDAQVFPGTQGGPLMHVVAAKAVCLFEALQPDFRAYQLQVVSNAKALAARLAHNSLRIVSGGTDNHLLLVDLRPVGVNGAEAQQSLDEAGITVNKNAIPFDTFPVSKPAGIRLGTPAITTRGAREEEMMEIADLITEAITHRDDPARIAAVRTTVRELTGRFPLPTPPPPAEG